MTLLNTCGCNNKNYNKAECRLVVLIVVVDLRVLGLCQSIIFASRGSLICGENFVFFHSLNNYFFVISLKIGVGFGS